MYSNMVLLSINTLKTVIVVTIIFTIKEKNIKSLKQNPVIKIIQCDIENPTFRNPQI